MKFKSNCNCNRLHLKVINPRSASYKQFVVCGDVLKNTVCGVGQGYNYRVERPGKQMFYLKATFYPENVNCPRKLKYCITSCCLKCHENLGFSRVVNKA